SLPVSDCCSCVCDCPGVTHNIPLLREIITHPRFISGDITTNFLPEEYPEGFKGHQLTSEGRRELIATAAALYVSAQLRSQRFLGNLRVSTTPQERRQWELCVELEKGSHTVAVSRSGSTFTVSYTHTHKNTHTHTHTHTEWGLKLLTPLIK
uniref:Propionyl-coenzyme A carboxylase BT domain-containing protein n=1 Tax=Hucho hucho TaxID=62062 RepID=A0A4W5LCD8_9TELE